MNCRKDYEAVLLNFLKSLKSNNTLLNLTYNQSPPTTNCGLFVQLMSALSQNKLSLTLGHAQVVPFSAKYDALGHAQLPSFNELECARLLPSSSNCTFNALSLEYDAPGHARLLPPTAKYSAVILHSKTCFKICWNGFVSAVKLADARSITVLEAYGQDFSLSNCSCQTSNTSKSESRSTIPCNNCERNDPAVTYCSDCPSYLCESCLTEVHQKLKQCRTHKLKSIEIISPDLSAVADSLRSSSLSVLDISECTLTDEVANHIGAGLADNKSLKQLNIKILFITEAVYIFRALEHNNSIKRLKMSLAEGICTSEKVCMSLYQMLKSNKSLIVLDLSGFGVTDAVAQHIACGLTENTTLQALNTNSNKLKCQGAGYVLQTLQQNKSLSTLKVFNLYVQITRMPLTLSVATEASDKQSLSLFVSSFVHNTTMEKLKMFTGNRVLDLSGCSITDAEVEKIAAGLTDNSSLKELDLSENEITGVGAAHIFKSLEKNTSLNKLLLSCNSKLAIHNSELFYSKLKQMLATNKSLSVLDLSECGINDVSAQHIASGVMENKTLQALSINSDQLKSDGAGYILQSLQQNETLKILRIFSLHIQITSTPLTLSVATGFDNKHSLSLLVSSFVRNTTMEKLQMFTGIGVLDLSGCSITDAEVEKIAAGLTSNSSLKELDLSENKITSIGAAHIFRSLEHNVSLDKLLLSCNSQLGLGNNEMFTSSLQQMLTTNKSLLVLDLSHCGITDEIMKYIGAGLTKNKSLTALNIDSEYLTKEGTKCLYQSLRQNEAITILRQFNINLEVLHNPFGLVISTECDTHALLKILKSLEQETTVDKLVIDRSATNQHYFDERLTEQKGGETLGCAMEKILIVSQTLRILDLQNCHCGDVLTGHIATALAKNCSVKRLVMKVTIVGAARLFKSLEHNTSLEELDVSCYSFRYVRDYSEALGLAVEEMLTVNQTIRIVSLHHLSDMITSHFATGLTKNNSVKQVVLIVTDVGAAHIFKSLEHNTSLEELVILKGASYYQSAKDDGETLGSAIQRMLTVNQTLRVLNLQNCYLDDVITNCLSTGLTDNNSVKQLKLKVPTDIGVAHIFKSLKYNTSLEELELTSADYLHMKCLALPGNAIEGDHDALGCVVEEMLTVNQTLRVLSLQNYHLSDESIGHFATGLAKNSSIKRLILKSNRITSIGAVHIFKSLEHNTSLEELDLSSNDFSRCQSATEEGETLGCAVEGMLTTNHTLKMLNLQDCCLSYVFTGHIVSGLQFNDICICKYGSTSHSDATYESYLNP